MRIARPGIPTGLLNDDDVFRFGVDIRLFEQDVGVAFVSGDETRAHLDGVGAQLHNGADVGAGVNAAGGYDRNRLAIPGENSSDLFDHFGNQLLQRNVRVKDLAWEKPRWPPALGPSTTTASGR